MNGKIKTKFAALFAVALMITVCVVPVVGGVDYSEAAVGPVKPAADDVKIEGYIYDATLTKIVGTTGIKVFYGDGKFDYVNVGNDGKYTIYVQPGSYKLKVDTKGTAYESYAFPEISVDSIGGFTGVDFIAGTVSVTGALNLYDGSDSVLSNTKLTMKDVEVNVGGQKVKTDDSGVYTFYATPGQEYKATASFAGISFESPAMVATTASNQTLNLEAKDYLLKASVSAPFGTLTTSLTTSGKAAAATVGAFTFVKSNNSYEAYAKLTYSSSTDTSAVDGVFSYGYGIAKSAKCNLIAAGATGGNVTTSVNLITSGTINNYAVTVGDIPVNASVKLVSTSASGAADYGKVVNANVVNGEFFVGPVFDYTAYESNTSTGVISAYKLETQYAGYYFNEPTSSSMGAITSTNEAKITVESPNAKTAFNISANNAVVGADGYVTDEDYSDSKYTFTFYVPLGANVSVSAPANYTPASEKFTAVNGETTVVFTYAGTIEYAGQVLLNEVPVALATETNIIYSTDGGKSYVAGGEAVSLVPGTDDIAPYYKITLPRSVDAADVVVRLALDTNKLADGYLFKADKNFTGFDDITTPFTAPVSIENGVIGSFNVNAVNQTINIEDANGVDLSGMEVSFVMVKGTAFDEKDIVAELGSAVTDSNGDAKVSAAEPLPVDNTEGAVNYTIFAIPSGSATVGDYTFANEAYSTASASAKEATYFGYYTKTGESLSGFGMSFIAKNGADLVAFGNAKIIDNMYYVVAPENTAETYAVSVKAVDGFEFVSGGVDGYLKLTAYNVDIQVKAVDAPKYTIINGTNDEFSDNVVIEGADLWEDVEVGTVLTLSAEKVCYEPLVYTVQYTYTDSAIKYEFAGWYVNGKLLTKELDATYTVSEDAVIVAQYDESIDILADSTDVAEPAGVSTPVLIVGIVAVIVALIGVVLAVVRKE